MKKIAYLLLFILLSNCNNRTKNTTETDVLEQFADCELLGQQLETESQFEKNNDEPLHFVAIDPYDYDIRMEKPEVQQSLMLFGEIPGKTIRGNLGQTLMPGNVSASGKSSTNSNVQIIINGKGSLNHKTVGIAHEFGHVVLYLRGLPYGHTQPGVDEFVYGRASIMSKRLGYDF